MLASSRILLSVVVFLEVLFQSPGSLKRLGVGEEQYSWRYYESAKAQVLALISRLGANVLVCWVCCAVSCCLY